MTQPKVFIASSREGLETAQELGRQLQTVAEVITWPETFQVGRTVAESLTEVTDRSDFAVFILTADDQLGGNEPRWSPRQNVIFELGFLAGRLGLTRTFLLVTDPGAVTLPTDLAGTNYIALPTRGQAKLALAVAPAADIIRREMRQKGPRRHNTVEYSSCFISYSWQDKQFAATLHDDLVEAGVRCWLDEKEMRTGDRLTDQIDRALQAHDKVLLVLSQASVRSEWVRLELRNALRLEEERHKTVLFPLRLDESAFDMSGPEFDQLREKYITDFSGWKETDMYRRAFSRLVRDLAISASVESGRQP